VDQNGVGPYTYATSHLHFHSPAEHAYNNEIGDMELHIVHDLKRGPNMDKYRQSVAVIGVVYKAYDDPNMANPFLAKLNLEKLDVSFDG